MTTTERTVARRGAGVGTIDRAEHARKQTQQTTIPHSVAESNINARAAVVAPIPSTSSSLSNAIASSLHSYPADWTASSLPHLLENALSDAQSFDDRLSALLAERSKLDSSLVNSVPTLSARIASLASKSRALTQSTIDTSAASARGLSAQVRSLDIAANRVASALNVVERIVEVRESVGRVRSKMEQGNLHQAAEEMHRVLTNQYNNTQIGRIDGGTPTSPTAAGLTSPSSFSRNESAVSFALLLDLERECRLAARREMVERCVRQARNYELMVAAGQSGSGNAGGAGGASRSSPLESAALLRLARVWSHLGHPYWGLILHSSQVRFELLWLFRQKHWSIHAQLPGSVLDYTKIVSAMIDTVQQALVRHVLPVQRSFGQGAQWRLVQEVLNEVLDREVVALVNHMIEQKKIKDPKRTPDADDIITKIKMINMRVMSGGGGGVSGGRGGGGAQTSQSTFYTPRDPLSSPSGLLHIPSLDELLEEIKGVVVKIEHLLKGINHLARQAYEFLEEGMEEEGKRREARRLKEREAIISSIHPTTTSSASTSPSSEALDQFDQQQSDSERIFDRFLTDPSNLSLLPSLTKQQDRSITMLFKLLQSDEKKRNILGLPIHYEAISRSGKDMFSNNPSSSGSKAILSPDIPVPASLLHLPSSSSFLIHGFGCSRAAAFGGVGFQSKVFDSLLTLVGKYVLIEEYYVNVNVDKAVAIDEHEAVQGSLRDFDGVPPPGGPGSSSGSTAPSSQGDDLEGELEAAEWRAKARERERAAASLGSLASAAITSLQSSSGGGGSGPTYDPYLYLTGIGASPNGIGIPHGFLISFSTHKTSTLVDNVCFLYKKVLLRSLHTSNRDAIYSTMQRVHENFSRKLIGVFESTIHKYEMKYGARRKGSLTSPLHANPAGYLFGSMLGAAVMGSDSTSSGSGSSRSSNLLGAWVSSAASGISSTSSRASWIDVWRKSRADSLLVLTLNNLEIMIENMMNLMKMVDTTLEDMFGEGEGEGGENEQSQQQPATATTTTDGTNESSDGSTSTGGVTSSQSSSLTTSHYFRGLSLDSLKEKVSDFHSTLYSYDSLVARGVQFLSDGLWLRVLPRLALLSLNGAELYAQPDLTSQASDLSDRIIAGYLEVFRRDVLPMRDCLSDNNFYQTVFKLIKLTVRYLENMILPKQTLQQQQQAQAQQLAYEQYQYHQAMALSGVPFDPTSPPPPSASSNASSPSSGPRRLVFTQSGGVTFDKQVRTLANYFTNELTPNLEKMFMDTNFILFQPQTRTATGTGTAAQSGTATSLRTSTSASVSSRASIPSSYSSWRVGMSGSAASRQLFSRLSHMASILAVDRPAEVLEYTERELFNLKKDEVRRVLSLRKDFSEREINQLKL